MRRLACPAVVAFVVLAACADLTSPKGRSLVIPQPWPLRMIDSVAGPTLQLDGAAVSFRVFGACPGDLLQTWPLAAARGIAFALRRPPDAPRRCEALSVVLPIGHPPPGDSVAELSVVIRNADGSEQRHVVRLQYPQDAPWWPQRCRWQGRHLRLRAARRDASLTPRPHRRPTRHAAEPRRPLRAAPRHSPVSSPSLSEPAHRLEHAAGPMRARLHGTVRRSRSRRTS